MKRLILIAIAFAFLFGTEFHNLQHSPCQIPGVFTVQRHTHQYQNNSIENNSYGQDDSDVVESAFTETSVKYFTALKRGKIKKLTTANYKPALYHPFILDLPPPHVFV